MLERMGIAAHQGVKKKEVTVYRKAWLHPWVTPLLTAKANQLPLMFTPQVPVVPLRRPDEMLIPSLSWMQALAGYEDIPNEQRIPTMITWSYDGKTVAVEGSWDNWKTRLSSDANAGASEALAKQLVNAALRLAQSKGSGSQDLITHHLNNGSTSAAEKQLLQRCLAHNGKAISELSLANNDLNSDSILDMVEEMQGAAAATKDCQYIIKGARFTALEDMNWDLIKLSEIGIVSTKYFSAEDFY